MSTRVSFRDRDMAPPQQESRLSAHSEKERRRKENEYNEGLKLGKEKQLQRQKAALQVVKGVAKLAQIRKARDIFLSKHVSVQHLARLLGVKMGQRISLLIENKYTLTLLPERLQAALKRAGMVDVSYDHCNGIVSHCLMMLNFVLQY
jgi:ribosomal protein S4